MRSIIYINKASDRKDLIKYYNLRTLTAMYNDLIRRMEVMVELDKNDRRALVSYKMDILDFGKP